jgi:hypothetical protein
VVRRQTRILVERTRHMSDLLMIVYSVAFFVVALLYVNACEKLR